ncbi:hypothetical protein Lal_00019006 [Lupinus albus]|nr:hypothetical protein Lal_00019006 [Lupinus albus]
MLPGFTNEDVLVELQDEKVLQVSVESGNFMSRFKIPDDGNLELLKAIMHNGNSEILFDNWPGDKTGMYVLALVFVFLMSFLVEFLSSTRFTKPGSNHLAANSLVQTLLHLLKVGLCYLVMLALMSFNVGVFLVAVIGHAMGFFFFGSNAFKKRDPCQE